MICLETLGKLRRRHLVNGDSISAIARDTPLSRQTVRQSLAACEDPRYRRQDQPCPQLGPCRETVTAWLEVERQRPVWEHRTAMRLFHALRQEGYRGGYDSVRRFVKRGKPSPCPAVTQAVVPVAFAPGAKDQFDWSHEVVELGGGVQTVKVAHFRLCYSRRALVAASRRDPQERVFAAHNRAVAAWGGVPVAGRYAHPNPVVAAILVGQERQFNRRFLALLNHYLIESMAGTPAAGWENGHMENPGGTLREWLFPPRLQFARLEDLNAWLAPRCQDREQRPHPDQQDRPIGPLFAEARAQLRPFTAGFDGSVEQTLRVSSTGLVHDDRKRYSVPAAYAGKPESLPADADRMRLVAEEQVVAEHRRAFGRGHASFEPWHYLPILERTPGARRDRAPFQQWDLPTAVETVRAPLLNQPGGDNAFVEWLLAARHPGLDPLDRACTRALERGLVTAAGILNDLSRLTAPTSPPPLETAATRRLTCEPGADCARYDRLRRPEVGHAP
ncbi:MAG TPA: IS21 family transposase [Phycisphaerae bacterium]|nr:IS21 family transposase [Phycisphaerae bacterium]